jgi:hypothetical protein
MGRARGRELWRNLLCHVMKLYLSSTAPDPTYSHVRRYGDSSGYLG